MPFLRCYCGSFTFRSANGHYKCSTCDEKPCKACGKHTNSDDFCKYCKTSCSLCTNQATHHEQGTFYCDGCVNPGYCTGCEAPLFGMRVYGQFDVCAACLDTELPKCVKCQNRQEVSLLVQGHCDECLVACEFCPTRHVESPCPPCCETVPQCRTCQKYTLGKAEEQPMCEACVQNCYVCSNPSISDACMMCQTTVPPCVTCYRLTTCAINGESLCLDCTGSCADCNELYKPRHEDSLKVCMPCREKYEPCKNCSTDTKFRLRKEAVCVDCLRDCHKCHLKFIQFEEMTSKSTRPLCQECLSQYQVCCVCTDLTLNKHGRYDVHEKCLRPCSFLGCRKQVPDVASFRIPGGEYACTACRVQHLGRCTQIGCTKDTFNKFDGRHVCQGCLQNCSLCSTTGMNMTRKVYRTETGKRGSGTVCNACEQKLMNCRKCRVHVMDMVDGSPGCVRCAPLCKGYQCRTHTNLGHCMACQQKIRPCVHCQKRTTRRHHGNTVCRTCVGKYRKCRFCTSSKTRGVYYQGVCPSCIISHPPCEVCGDFDCRKRHGTSGDCVACGEHVESVSNCPDAKCRRENVWCQSCFQKSYEAQNKIQKCLGCAKRVYHDDLLTDRQRKDMVGRAKRLCSIRCPECHKEPTFLDTQPSGDIVSGTADELHKRGVKPSQVRAIELRAYLLRLQLLEKQYHRPPCGCKTFTMCVRCMSSVDGYKYDADGNTMWNAAQTKRLRHDKRLHVCKTGLEADYIRLCPSCGIAVCKVDGCPSITCVCGRQFDFRYAKKPT